jgi:DNA helicase II / ATP-dependent DNA helicase PcrA
MQMTVNLIEKRKLFAMKSAKAWQNFFDAQGLLPNITLSPEQISIVQQEENQMLINGSAGSGKSLTLVYKLLKVMDQENTPKRILYCSFNSTLIDDARKRITQSAKFHEIKGKHVFHMNTFHNVAVELLQSIGFKNTAFLRVNLENIRRNEDFIIRRTIALMANYMDTEEYERLPIEQKLYKTHAGTFLMEEILWMKANGFITPELYYNCERSGRGNTPRLTKEQRKTVFTLYEQYHEMLKTHFYDYLDLEDYALLLLKHLDEIPESLKYDYIFVDEVQDLQSMQLKALVSINKKSIVVSGDPKQRIYKRSPFSYRDLGLNIEGKRNKNLKTNYRSTKQIMSLASGIKFLDEENDRVDNLRFVREGEKPNIHYFSQQKRLYNHLVKAITQIQQSEPGASIAVIHRNETNNRDKSRCPVYLELNRNFDVITTSKYAKRFDFDSKRKPVFYTDAFSVKGLEFDYVFLIHFDRYHFPSKKRIEDLNNRSGGNKAGDTYMADFDEILNDEKKILYVAITRAKKMVELLYTGATFKSISQFVRDFEKGAYKAIGFNSSIYSS